MSKHSKFDKLEAKLLILTINNRNVWLPIAVIDNSTDPPTKTIKDFAKENDVDVDTLTWSWIHSYDYYDYKV
jgi:hypothetical protein